MLQKHFGFVALAWGPVFMVMGIPHSDVVYKAVAGAGAIMTAACLVWTYKIIKDLQRKIDRLAATPGDTAVK